MTVQTRRQRLSPLAIVLPHPALPISRSKSRSSLISRTPSADLEPHTPQSGHAPSLALNIQSIYYPANRKSSDSWNSSNADDMQHGIEVEWQHEEALLLSRTLDALPSHLLTPFNGPIPPSNLLDKIARGVSQAKGPVEWPHSVRSTRVKLLELARAKANDDDQRDRLRRRALVIEEEENENAQTTTTTTSSTKKKKTTKENVPSTARQQQTPQPSRLLRPRPLYRQSSMDFIKPGAADDLNNKTIASLSNRLQRPGRVLANKGHQHQHYHPYMRPSPTSTPSRSPLSSLCHVAVPPEERSSRPTSTSSTLSSLSGPSSSHLSPPVSDGVPSLILSHESGSESPYSTLASSSSTSSVAVVVVKASGSASDVNSDFGLKAAPQQPAMTPRPVIRIGLKRSPEYGAARQEAKVLKERAGESDSKHVRNGSYPSSDEEEKQRSVRVKKMRVGSVGTATPTPVPKPATTSFKSKLTTTVPATPASTLKVSDQTETKLKKKSTKPLPMNLDRNPSMFGEELSVPPSLPPSTLSTTATVRTIMVPASPQCTKERKTKPKPFLPMNLERNPSMLGEELPFVAPTPSGVVEPLSNSDAVVAVVDGPSPPPPPVPPKDSIRSPKAASRGSAAAVAKKVKAKTPPRPAISTSTVLVSPSAFASSPTVLGSSPPHDTHDVNKMDIDVNNNNRHLSPTPALPPESPCPSSSSPAVRTLRRVRVRRLVPARRISFGSIIVPDGNAPPAGGSGGGDGLREGEECLGSAIQLA